MRPDEGYINVVSLVRVPRRRYCLPFLIRAMFVGVRGQGYTSDPPLPEVRAVNREYAERQKEQKDAEKRCRERKRKDREAREKENRAREKQGKSPIPMPDSTPEPVSLPSACVGGLVPAPRCPGD